MKLDDDTFETLERLEDGEEAPFTRVPRRSHALLQYVMAAGYVENAGPGTMRISRLGRQALAEHREQG